MKGRTILSHIAICDNHCRWLGSVAVNWGRHIRCDERDDRTMGHDAIFYSIVVYDFYEIVRWKDLTT